MAEVMVWDAQALAGPEAGRCYWMGFTLDHGEAAARADFRRRYGREPERVLVSRSVLLVGPVPAGLGWATTEDRLSGDWEPGSGKSIFGG